jgi:hypothetical protein
MAITLCENESDQVLVPPGHQLRSNLDLFERDPTKVCTPYSKRRIVYRIVRCCVSLEFEMLREDQDSI